MRPLRVLTIGHSYVVRLNRSIAAAIAAHQEIELTVAAPSYYRGDYGYLHLEPDTQPTSYQLVPLSAHLSRWVHAFWYHPFELRRLLREGAFDLIHVWEEPFIFAGYQVYRAAGSTGALRAFSTCQSLAKTYPPPFRQFEEYVAKRSDGWIALGDLVFKTMLQKGYPAQTGRTIPFSVDTNVFRPLPDEREGALRELGLKPPVIGYVGRFVAEKGLQVLMKAFEQLKRDCSLLLLGSGPLQAQLEQWIASQRFGDRVRIHLAKSAEVPRFLSAMDMLVAPSQTTAAWKEQFGRMLVEAMACRVPVIGSDSGEIPHVIGPAGRIVRESDVAGWTAAIDQMLASVPAREALAESGYQRVRELYSVEQVAQAYVEFFLRTAARKKERDAIPMRAQA